MKFVQRDKVNVIPRKNGKPKRLYKRSYAEVSCYKIKNWSVKDGVVAFSLSLEPLWCQLFTSELQAKNLMIDLYHGEIG